MNLTTFYSEIFLTLQMSDRKPFYKCMTNGRQKNASLFTANMNLQIIPDIGVFWLM